MLHTEVQELRNNIEVVYAQGYPAKASSWLGMPQNLDISETYVTNGTVKVAVMEGDQRIDIVAPLQNDICVNGDIPKEPGYHYITVSINESCVLIEENEGE
jgi:hypothetical protein